MSMYVQVINGEVKEVWDTAPADGVGNNGWKNAIEIRPNIAPNRQMYTGHSFDLNADPVQIIWGTRDVTVDERKDSMKANANFKYQQLVNQKSMPDSTVTDADIATALATKDNTIAAIDAATTHDQLDAIA